jgi:hypothetical protein
MRAVHKAVYSPFHRNSSVPTMAAAAEDGKMSVKSIVRGFMVLVALLTIAGCGHVQTLSTKDCVSVQDFGCPGGDKPCMYAPYCRP